MAWLEYECDYDYFIANGTVEDAAIAVFDSYQTHEGLGCRLMIVVFPAKSYRCEIFKWTPSGRFVYNECTVHCY